MHCLYHNSFKAVVMQHIFCTYMDHSNHDSISGSKMWLSNHVKLMFLDIRKAHFI